MVVKVQINEIENRILFVQPDDTVDVEFTGSLEVVTSQGATVRVDMPAQKVTCVVQRG